MYGHGNHDPHNASPSFQQRPPGPLPPPPPTFQQGPPAPPHPIMQQQVSSVGPPHVGHQPGPPVYHHAPPPLHASVQQGPQPHGGMFNTGQSYLHPPPPPPPLRSAPLPHPYPSTKHSSQYSGHLGAQNVHHIPPSVPLPPPPPLGPPRSEILQTPPPTRIPPPPPHSQGQTQYRTPVMPTVCGGVQGLQHVPPPPPPPSATSSYFTTPPPPFQLVPPPPPPPLPSSPPPLPPSPPPPAPPQPSSGTSSTPTLAVSDLPPTSSSNKLSRSEVNVSDSADKVVSSVHTRDNMTTGDGYINCEGRAVFVMGSTVKDGSLELLPPPPRPMNEKVVHNIENLCQLIAEKGPGSEAVFCQKESRNLEFEFLNGGEAGSEAAIAHGYYLWMKKKYSLEFILRKGNLPSDSLLIPSEVESSVQPDSVTDTGASHSPADSDMDMEDDITQFDKDQEGSCSFEDPIPEYGVIYNELDVKEQLTVSKSPPIHSLAKNASPRNLSGSWSSGLVEQGSADIIPGKYFGQPSQGGSPIRLLQDYASDDSADDDEHSVEDVTHGKVSSSDIVGDASLNRHLSNYLEADVGSKSPCRHEEESRPLSQVVVASSSLPVKAPDFSSKSHINVEETVIRSIVTVKMNEQVDIKDGRQDFFLHSAYQETSQEQDALDGGNVDVVPDSQKEDAKCGLSQLKVDEFGRLVRNGSSDSDSDDFHNTQRRGKRGRSWSRSLSPRDRRRRRSPWRRRERRSRSRSWSPQKRRSRSKSPINRRVGNYGGDKTRREKGQMPDCLDFLRGRCHRGASCRFLHCESDKSNGSRRNRSKHHYLEVPPSLNNTEIQELEICHDLPASSFVARRDGNVNEKGEVDSTRGAPQSITSDQKNELVVTEVNNSERLREAVVQLQETREVQKPAEQSTHLLDNDNCHKSGETHLPLFVGRGVSTQPVTEVGSLKSPGDTAELVLSSDLSIEHQQAQTNFSVPILQNADHQPQKVDGSFASDSSPDQKLTTFPDKLPLCDPTLNNLSLTQSYASTNSVSHPFSSDNILSQLPPPPLSQGMSAPHLPQLPNDYHIMQPTANFPIQSTHVESIPAYQVPFPNQTPHFSIPPISAWTSLPPPPPPPRPLYVNHLIVNDATSTPSSIPQFRPNHMPPKNDFASQSLISPYQTELPNRSQVGELEHQIHLPVQEHYRPPLHLEENRSKHAQVCNPLTQAFGGPNLIREDFPSSSYAQGSVHPQSMSFLRESPARKMHSFPSNELPSRELYKLASQTDPYSQQQLPPYGLQHPPAADVSARLSLPGSSTSSTSRFPSDIIERNQLSRLTDFGGSRISTHYNPYASTFDQPLRSMFSSSAFRQETDTPYSNKYDAPISLSHLPVDAVGVGSLGSRQMSSSPNAARAVGQKLHRSSGGDQYDPLFDSIEPSPNSVRKYDRVQKWECMNDSDIMLRLNASHKLLDVEEHNQKKVVGAFAAATSLENDEYGETADAEVGAVENGSPSSPMDEANTAAGEIEIDQIKSPGKSKKSKDSRSMKLFKVALADFVKEVLKPSWRQGNMSKEAFKTIVKKTVDKVSGAMKGHQVPKSQAKINHYIDSSQRKLTKLVMGYVDKYVKV